jgi:hypothetical protein
MKNTINDPGEGVSEADLVEAEGALGFKLPTPLRSLYLICNGGRPSRYIYMDDQTETSVSEILQIAHADGAGALDSYRIIVVERKLAPMWMFPFAVDSGGDYFLIDVRSDDGLVSFMDSSSGQVEIRNTNLGLESFLDSLQAEE